MFVKSSVYLDGSRIVFQLLFLFQENIFLLARIIFSINYWASPDDTAISGRPMVGTKQAPYSHLVSKSSLIF